MSYRSVGVFSTLAAVIILALPANAQSVISTHSGVVHFFEGAVYLGDRPLESHLGKYPSVPQGGELRTEEGRAEVLLTPGTFLRIGDRTAIRMVANGLADTKVELSSGAAIVNVGESNPGTSVSLIYKDWRIHFLNRGAYRVNSDPPCLWVRLGKAEVFSAVGGQPISVEGGMSLPFAEVLVTEQSSGQPSDALSDWARGRNESISADNAIAAQIDEDPASRASDWDGLTYFPYLGVPSLGVISPGVGPYGSYAPYQSGFNSIYLPGYTYRPLILGIMGRGLRTSVPSYRPYVPSYRPYVPYQGRNGVSPGAGVIVSPPRIPSPTFSAPRIPTTRPAPVHAVSPVGGHVGGHR
jgi:hypothetical protein